MLVCVSAALVALLAAVVRRTLRVDDHMDQEQAERIAAHDAHEQHLETERKEAQSHAAAIADAERVSDNLEV